MHTYIIYCFSLITENYGICAREENVIAFAIMFLLLPPASCSSDPSTEQQILNQGILGPPNAWYTARFE